MFGCVWPWSRAFGLTGAHSSKLASIFILKHFNHPELPYNWAFKKDLSSYLFYVHIQSKHLTPTSWLIRTTVSSNLRAQRSASTSTLFPGSLHLFTNIYWVPALGIEKWRKCFNALASDLWTDSKQIIMNCDNSMKKSTWCYLKP